MILISRMSAALCNIIRRFGSSLQPAFPAISSHLERAGINGSETLRAENLFGDPGVADTITVTAFPVIRLTFQFASCLGWCSASITLGRVESRKSRTVSGSRSPDHIVQSLGYKEKDRRCTLGPSVL